MTTPLDILKSAKYIVWFHDGFGKWDPMPSESKDNVREIIEANKPEDDGPYEYIVTCPVKIPEPPKED